MSENFGNRPPCALPIFAAMLLCLSSVVTAADSYDGALAGRWRNPKNSVHVEIADCGQAICGVVVWASEKAKADARQGGTDPLIGVSLLRDFAKAGDAKWRGKAFVSDLNKTVTGTIELIAPDSFRVRSCALAVFCRTQVWRRIG